MLQFLEKLKLGRVNSVKWTSWKRNWTVEPIQQECWKTKQMDMAYIMLIKFKVLKKK